MRVVVAVISTSYSENNVIASNVHIVNNNAYCKGVKADVGGLSHLKIESRY
jgi:hypothetical protein